MSEHEPVAGFCRVLGTRNEYRDFTNSRFSRHPFFFRRLRIAKNWKELREQEEKGKKRKKKREQGAKRARKLGTGSREDERKLLKARQGMIYISFQSFALKMVNALNDGINNCIQRTAGIDLKTPVRGTPVEYPCNDLVRHSSGRREIVCE